MKIRPKTFRKTELKLKNCFTQYWPNVGPLSLIRCILRALNFLWHRLQGLSPVASIYSVRHRKWYRVWESRQSQGSNTFPNSGLEPWRQATHIHSSRVFLRIAWRRLFRFALLVLCGTDLFSLRYITFSAMLVHLNCLSQWFLFFIFFNNQFNRVFKHLILTIEVLTRVWFSWPFWKPDRWRQWQLKRQSQCQRLRSLIKS